MSEDQVLTLAGRRITRRPLSVVDLVRHKDALADLTATTSMDAVAGVRLEPGRLVAHLPALVTLMEAASDADAEWISALTLPDALGLAVFLFNAECQDLLNLLASLPQIANLPTS